MQFTRYAIYYLPDGPLADFGAHWLGWDIRHGTLVAQPHIDRIDDITRKPRKYGFHATLKPPFRLCDGTSVDDLKAAMHQLATDLPAASCDGLRLSQHGAILALTPHGEAGELARVADACVKKLDSFRAPPPPEELARRKTPRLTDRQLRNLDEWGYPYVLQDFRFHMTLTGRVQKDSRAYWHRAVADRLPPLPQPFTLDALSLVAERTDGAFCLIEKAPLTG